MGSQERFLPVEPKVIYPDIHEEARIMFSKYWSVGNAFLDQLVYEILVKYRYDKPLTVLSIFTASPIRIIRRPNGTSYAEYPVRFDGEEKSGNCHALCCKMLLDSDFRQWLVELEEQTGCRISTYFTEGNSPSYFVSKKMNHFWLMLYHGRTGTNLLVDPSFQRVSRGKGYRFETNDNQLIDRESQIPRGGSSHIELDKL